MLWLGGGGIQAMEHRAFKGAAFTLLAVSDLEELADSNSIPDKDELSAYVY